MLFTDRETAKSATYIQISFVNLTFLSPDTAVGPTDLMPGRSGPAGLAFGSTGLNDYQLNLKIIQKNPVTAIIVVFFNRPTKDRFVGSDLLEGPEKQLTHDENEAV